MIGFDSNCIGCGACKNICPTKCIEIERKNGQYVPVIDEKMCIKCNACDSVCVAQRINTLERYTTIMSYYGYAVKQEERVKSSSGGIFYSIATEFIRSGGIVVGAAYDDSFSVRHIIVIDEDSLPKIRGSKYVESDLQYVFREVKKLLDAEKKVLFSGVPCQIGAIRTFLKKDYENLYTCEVFCHGAPRSGLFNSYISWIENKNGKVTDFNFRSKHYGWSNPSYEILTEKRRLIQLHKDNVYHLMFGNHVSLRDSCYDCQFRNYERFADLSLGDFWGIEKYYYDINTKDGVSAILVNTKKGEVLLNSAHVYLHPCSINEIYDKNTWMIKNYDKPLEQTIFINDYNSMRLQDFFRKYEFKYKVTDRLKRILRRVFR